MRALVHAAVFAFMAFAAVALRSVADTSGGIAAEMKIELVDPRDDPQAAVVQVKVAVATNYLGQKLVSEVSTALLRGTPEDAVGIAHLQSVPRTGDPVPGMPQVKAFKLTSQRLINAGNHADRAEEQVLNEVARDLRLGTRPPEVIVQKITLPDGTEQWRGYRPLAALPACLACHGSADGQSPRLRSLLLQRATSTPAIGYKTGEWRGLLRVSVELPSADDAPAPTRAAGG